jgi:hypothetical protein
MKEKFRLHGINVAPRPRGASEQHHRACSPQQRRYACAQTCRSATGFPSEARVESAAITMDIEAVVVRRNREGNIQEGRADHDPASGDHVLL